MRETSREFVKALAERLYAAFRSTLEPQSFSEILADVHAQGFNTDAERVAWESIASIIVDYRADGSFGLQDYLEDFRLVQ